MLKFDNGVGPWTGVEPEPEPEKVWGLTVFPEATFGDRQSSELVVVDAELEVVRSPFNLKSTNLTHLSTFDLPEVNSVNKVNYMMIA